MRYSISNLEQHERLYLSKDGINFSHKNSIALLPQRENIFDADPENYFLFESELLEGNEPVGDGEVPVMYSDWHEKVYIDGKVYYAANSVMFRKLKDYFSPKKQKEK
ncbi:MAG TPA: hypothetical protein DEA47_02515 [Peptococcaceae bacterium]|nr:MAG: hypothetical protein XD50_0055 [Clostridia bacterium 41_269]HBT20233.1 hypothetical protein [Peptococcaceae bacterium]